MLYNRILCHTIISCNPNTHNLLPLVAEVDESRFHFTATPEEAVDGALGETNMSNAINH